MQSSLYVLQIKDLRYRIVLYSINRSCVKSTYCDMESAKLVKNFPHGDEFPCLI